MMSLRAQGNREQSEQLHTSVPSFERPKQTNVSMEGQLRCSDLILFGTLTGFGQDVMSLPQVLRVRRDVSRKVIPQGSSNAW